MSDRLRQLFVGHSLASALRQTGGLEGYELFAPYGHELTGSFRFRMQSLWIHADVVVDSAAVHAQISGGLSDAVAAARQYLFRMNHCLGHNGMVYVVSVVVVLSVSAAIGAVLELDEVHHLVEAVGQTVHVSRPYLGNLKVGADDGVFLSRISGLKQVDDRGVYHAVSHHFHRFVAEVVYHQDVGRGVGLAFFQNLADHLFGGHQRYFRAESRERAECRVPADVQVMDSRTNRAHHRCLAVAASAREHQPEAVCGQGQHFGHLPYPAFEVVARDEMPAALDDMGHVAVIQQLGHLFGRDVDSKTVLRELPIFQEAADRPLVGYQFGLCHILVFFWLSCTVVVVLRFLSCGGAS